MRDNRGFTVMELVTVIGIMAILTYRLSNDADAYGITRPRKARDQARFTPPMIPKQLPISQNENIKVKLIEPKYKEDTEILKIDDHKFIEWFFKPKAGEKIEIPFNYSVEYPIGTKIIKRQP